LLVRVAKDDGKCFQQAFAGIDSNNKKIVAFSASIQEVCSTEKQKQKCWMGVKVAAKLLEFHDLLVESDQTRTANSKREAAFVLEIRKLVDAAEKELVADAEKAPKSKAKKIDKYRLGGRALDNNIVNALPSCVTCPFCSTEGHHPRLVLVHFDSNQQLIDDYTKDYETACIAYDNTPAKDRPKSKPKCRSIKQLMACVCSLNHYKGNFDGVGCSECSSRRTIDPSFFAGQGPCMTCDCYCMAAFPLGEVLAIGVYMADLVAGIQPEKEVDKESGTFKHVSARSF
jgi:hypothetical protein